MPSPVIQVQKTLQTQLISTDNMSEIYNTSLSHTQPLAGKPLTHPTNIQTQTQYFHIYIVVIDRQ